MNNSRRFFIKQGGIAFFGLGMTSVPDFVKKAITAQKKVNKNKILVCIFQRGAMDGLMAVSPFNDSNLKALRPNLFMPVGGGKSPIDLNGKFALHPSFKSFESLYLDNNLAVIHGIGSPNTTRSHFDAQDFMETGTPFVKGTASGWLNRVLESTEGNKSIFKGVSITNAMPRSMYGEYPCLAVSDFKNFKLNSRTSKILSSELSLEELYDATIDDLQKDTSKESFEAMKTIEKLDFKNYTPSKSAKYPNSPLGNSLKQIAQLIKSDVGLEIGFAESNGWDTHFNQGTDAGIFARNANDLSSSIAALWSDIKTFQDDVVIMTMTEFGRTVKQNGTNGTDHGRASCSFVIGNSVKGGYVYEDMKDLSLDNLFEQRDLPVTTDYRSLFNAIAENHLGVKDKSKLFPDWKGSNIDIF
jgi:uncharacterized protein (DUF1501 family)